VSRSCGCGNVIFLIHKTLGIICFHQQIDTNDEIELIVTFILNACVSHHGWQRLIYELHCIASVMLPPRSFNKVPVTTTLNMAYLFH
jgi:hypothetical protein